MTTAGSTPYKDGDAISPRRAYARSRTSRRSERSTCELGLVAERLDRVPVGHGRLIPLSIGLDARDAVRGTPRHDGNQYRCADDSAEGTPLRLPRRRASAAGAAKHRLNRSGILVRWQEGSGLGPARWSSVFKNRPTIRVGGARARSATVRPTNSAVCARPRMPPHRSQTRSRHAGPTRWQQKQRELLHDCVPARAAFRGQPSGRATDARDLPLPEVGRARERVAGLVRPPPGACP